MSSKQISLDKLKQSQSAEIIQTAGDGPLRQHLLDMGLIPGRKLRLIQFAPLGDPMELSIGGYQLSLRLNEASNIKIKLIDNQEENSDPTKKEDKKSFIIPEHPGLGEGGNYHKEDTASPLPKNTVLNFALVGNQNCGKTTLFNRLTGSNQHVGNFPGVTVERKDGQIRGYKDTLLTDLPGIYSLSTYTSEEEVSRRFLFEQKPQAIINIVDASNLERNLYLTMQLMELDIPMVLALNMMDELKGNGGSVRLNTMEQALGLPVLPISAAKNEGIEELIQHAVHIAKYQERPSRQDFCDKEDYGGAVHRCLHGIMHLIEDHARRAQLPIRYAATRIVEGDAQVIDALKLTANELETIEHIIVQMEEERGLDRNAAMADMRFSFINKLCAQSVVKPRESKEYKRSRKIDEILLGKWSAIPIFLAVMVGVIWLSVDLIGAPLQELLAQAIERLSVLCDTALLRMDVSPILRSLISESIFGGVGMVVSFLPIIIVLFFFLSILEDSGYMARVAFVSDKLLRRLGLSGRSIVPLLIGFGCSVPAVMATRTLPSSHDRKMTILLTPYMSCSAKIPIYAFFTAAFFPGKGGLVLGILYLGAIFIGILVALVAKLFRKDEPSPFVMEMPNYRLPSIVNVTRLLWEKAKDFIEKAFSVIFVASIVIWLLQSFDFSLKYVSGEDSMLSLIAGLIAPVFAPLGLGDWRIVTALLSGFIAKESVVSTMQLLNVLPALNVLSAVSMLIFCLLYTPCIATIAVIRKELGRKWALGMVVFQCLVAWIVAWGVSSVVGLWI